MRSTRRPATPLALGALLALLALSSLGAVAASSLTVLSGAPESGFGTVVTAPAPGTGWIFSGLAVVTVPSGLVVASSNASHPTNLSGTAGTSLSVGLLSVGSSAIAFAFQLTPTAPNATEIEIHFAVAVTGPATVQTVYVATPAAPPGSALTVRFYVATTSPSFTGLTLESFSAQSALCTSVGVCP